MILTLITIGIFALCLTGVIIMLCNYDDDGPLFSICAFFAVASLIALVIMVGIIISTHVGVEADLYEDQQEREALIDSYNQYSIEYDNDITHSTAYKELRDDIYEFNSDLYSDNYYNNSPWLNWFYIDKSSIKPITITNGVAE